MASGNTQAFYTFDAIESGIFSELMSSLQTNDDDNSFKDLIKKNEESQALEDTICLVFLDYYFEEFG